MLKVYKWIHSKPSVHAYAYHPGKSSRAPRNTRTPLQNPEDRNLGVESRVHSKCASLTSLDNSQLLSKVVMPMHAFICSIQEFPSVRILFSFVVSFVFIYFYFLISAIKFIYSKLAKLFFFLIPVFSL